MKTAIFLGLLGCYDPSLRDCTVTCEGSGSDECADDQICRAGRCVGSSAPANSCELGDTTEVAVHVTVMGHGEVTLDGSATCDNDCTMQVTAGSLHRFVAASTADNKMFQMWSGACAGADETCAMTPSATMPMISVGAKFQ